jgi:hypothetical protein
VICTPETLRRLCRVFFPEMLPPSQWYVRLAEVFQEYGVDEVDVIGYLHAMFLHRKDLSPGNASVANSMCAPFGTLEHFGREVTLVVQVTKSERWLGRIIQFYKEIGVMPVFTVDGRTSGETRSILAANSVTCIEISGEPRDDSHLAVFSAIDTDWILRAYDDELPTPALLAFVDRAVKHSTNFVWGFPRVHCRYDAATDELRYSQFLPFGPLASADLQWRLVSRDDHPKERRSAATDAIFLNFDWVARSFAERVHQLRSQAVAPASLASFGLQEAIPDDWHMWASLRDRRFEDLARAIHRAEAEAVGTKIKGVSW